MRGGNKFRHMSGLPMKVTPKYIHGGPTSWDGFVTEKIKIRPCECSSRPGPSHTYSNIINVLVLLSTGVRVQDCAGTSVSESEGIHSSTLLISNS